MISIEDRRDSLAILYIHQYSVRIIRISLYLHNSLAIPLMDPCRDGTTQGPVLASFSMYREDLI